MANFNLDRIRFKWRSDWVGTTVYTKDDIVYFKDNMGMGEYITLDKKSDWMIFKSGSLGDKFNKFVCEQ